MARKKKSLFQAYRPVVLSLKIIYTAGLFIVGLYLIIRFVGAGEAQIKLRAFPYPYRAGLALCNDIEGTDTIEEFLAIQRYLCTEESTPWGIGLGLEFGNSLRFHDFTGVSGVTVFDGFGEINGESADILEELIRSGYIDVIQAYGEYPPGGFDSDYAIDALNFAVNRELSLAVWVNSLSPHSAQNIGERYDSQGDNPESEYYHTYLLERFGVRYVETYGFAGVIGQDVSPGTWDWLRNAGNTVMSLFASMRKGGWDLKFGNRLLSEIILDDDSRFLRFNRCLNLDLKTPLAAVDVNSVATTLSGENLDKLVESGGYMIAFTRLGSNLPYSEWAPAKARRALKGVANRVRAGRLFVTTTSRLLDYNQVHKNLVWDWTDKDGEYIIEIQGVKPPLEPYFGEEIEQLQGITFYSPNPENTVIYYKGEIIFPLQVNPPDYSGQGSVSIPWKWLTFPIITLDEGDET